MRVTVPDTFVRQAYARATHDHTELWGEHENSNLMGKLESGSLHPDPAF